MSVHSFMEYYIWVLFRTVNSYNRCTSLLVNLRRGERLARLYIL